MKWTAYLLALSLVLNSGCVGTFMFGREYKDGETVKKVSMCRASLASNTKVESVKVESAGLVNVELGKYSGAGDKESLEIISKLVVYSLETYYSGGAALTIKSLMDAYRSGEVDRVVKESEKRQLLEGRVPYSSTSTNSTPTWTGPVEWR